MFSLVVAIIQIILWLLQFCESISVSFNRFESCNGILELWNNSIRVNILKKRKLCEAERDQILLLTAHVSHFLTNKIH